MIKVKDLIKGKWDLTDGEVLHHFLGMKVDYDTIKGTLSISVPAYIDKIVESAGLTNANPTRSPMNTQVILDKGQGQVESYPYVQHIRQLN